MKKKKAQEDTSSPAQCQESEVNTLDRQNLQGCVVRCQQDTG